MGIDIERLQRGVMTNKELDSAADYIKHLEAELAKHSSDITVEAAIDQQNAIKALESEASEKADEIAILKNKVKELEGDLVNCTFEIGCLREGFDPTTGRDLVFTKPEDQHPSITQPDGFSE